ncbi:alpha/beta fold hydrolase [Desulfotalea psychrophila]|uniref:Related to haloalkane dehalogenase n=1 Tax=Desulfotalea psychrophila (strain LSv54 / DSM 12343) TaxID=177439 RepID=Q6AJW5_DESPS|nr:alpha/beta fold hydrolase [Desulfotalea psychrophila]CAG37361.1 related to haloalkane dehalogenase [Desulfotalea psychrophila LSv54]
MFTEYPFQSNYFEIGGQRLHYVDEGHGPVIVLVHGNPTWSFYYRRVISLLSKTHRIIAVDHMGCGLSDKPQDYSYTLQTHRQNLFQLLEHLQIEKYSLVVHDWGGAIGVGCAAFAPERVEKLVVLNTAAFRSTHIPLRISLCRAPLFGEYLVRGLNGFAWPASFMAVQKRLSKEVVAGYLAPYSNWEKRVAVYGFVHDIPLNSAHPSYGTLVEVERGLEALVARQVPTLILWGGKDFCFNDHFYRQWCERVPYAEKVYYENGGHYILEDEFADIAPRLERFFTVCEED